MTRCNNFEIVLKREFEKWEHANPTQFMTELRVLDDLNFG